MGSSGGGGGGNPGLLSANAAPMGDLPVAGKDSTIGDPFQYGKFQNFLPDIKAEGQNDMATGLRPDMFKYTSPGGGGGGSGDTLRDALAAAVTGGGAGGGGGAGMFGGVGSMGMGGPNAPGFRGAGVDRSAGQQMGPMMADMIAQPTTGFEGPPDPAAQAYAQQHLARYGYAPSYQERTYTGAPNVPFKPPET